ncbi:exosome complex exonuclease Rrp41 [Candidatus Methanoprimaticola sp. MG2]|uniref:exosome complex exonuclease Rrp41 n=1 Tax=Candidatus Methanoprimaticola sp. MG2 TaxID=3228838 RepID=UPI0039C6AAA6
MSGHTDMVLVDENGMRIDGRTAEEHRPIKIEAGVLHNADGSAYVEIGKNKVLAAVYGPRECHPRHLQNPQKAIVQVKYNMEAYSVSDRKRPGTDRRSIEISKITAEALEKVVLTELYPRASIDVYIEILQANAGTRCAGLTAASVALADAGIPMRDIVPAIAAGKADGNVLLDLNKEEDNYGQADVPIAIVPSTDEIVLLQMDGNMTRAEFDHAIELAVNACHEVHDLQVDALKRRYSKNQEASQ